MVFPWVILSTQRHLYLLFLSLVGGTESWQWCTGCFFSPLLSAALSFSLPVQRALSGWLAAAAPAKAGWKFITTETGAQCVMMAGQTSAPK